MGEQKELVSGEKRILAKLVEGKAAGTVEVKKEEKRSQKQAQQHRSVLAWKIQKEWMNRIACRRR